MTAVASERRAKTLVFRAWGMSARVRRRTVVAGGILWLVAGALVVTGASLGDAFVAPGDVIGALAGAGDSYTRLVILELRMPRVVTALLVGIALGASGAITQSLARNPLASPDVLGITAGASAAAVAVITAGTVSGLAGASAAAVPLPLAAIAGALIAAAAVAALSWRSGLDGLRLILIGIALGAMLYALTDWLLVAANITDAARATLWLAGSLSLARWDLVVMLAVAIALTLPVGLAAAPTAAALRFGDDTARSLGVRLSIGRGLLVLCAIVLAATAVAAAGPIAFVALVAPQVAMRLARTAGPPLLTSAVVGAVLLLAADLIARVVLPDPLPVGIVTAVLGGPYLVVLLLRQSRKGIR